jgi:hypothetical protein
MEKLVYILWKHGDRSIERFKAEMLGSVAEQLLALGIQDLSVNLADEDVAHTRHVRLTRFDPPIAGLVSFWLDDADQRVAVEKVLAGLTSRYAGYSVLESVAIANTAHTAPVGKRTPGINVVACIERPEHMTPEVWLEHWLEHHKRVAIETQSTFAYVRNIVARRLTADAPPWAGIVEEHFPAEAVTNPMLWYRAGDDEETFKRNVGRMMESVQAFLDVSRVESNPMSQYVMSANA